MEKNSSSPKASMHSSLHVLSSVSLLECYISAWGQGMVSLSIRHTVTLGLLLFVASVDGPWAVVLRERKGREEWGGLASLQMHGINSMEALVLLRPASSVEPTPISLFSRGLFQGCHAQLPFCQDNRIMLHPSSEESSCASWHSAGLLLL